MILKVSNKHHCKLDKIPRNFCFNRLHVISSYAISAAAISTVHTFNASHFQPLTLSTACFPSACKFNRRKFDLFKQVQGYSIFSRRSKTIEVIKKSIELHQSDNSDIFQRSYWTNYQMYQT